MTAARGPSVVVAPNAFRGGPSSAWVAHAIAAGVRAAYPGADVAVVPLADGGDGSLAVATAILGLEPVEVTVTGPDGDPVAAVYARRRSVAFIEMASASGLALVRRAGPLDATTAGTGMLVRHALDHGADDVLIGAGGAPSVDLGAGALHALGAVFLDRAGRPLPPVPRFLGATELVDLSAVPELGEGRTITVLSDVRTPARRNSELYGPQKGVTPEQAGVLSEATAAVAGALSRLPGRPSATDLLDGPFLGAGGGMAGGLHAGLHATVVPGAGWFIEQSSFADRLDGCDLVITAEGRFDRSSAEGKLPYEVLDLCARRGTPAVLVAGQVLDRCLPGDTSVVELGLPREAIAGPATFDHVRGEVAVALRRIAA